MIIIIIKIILTLLIMSFFIWHGYNRGKQSRKEFNRKGYVSDRLVSDICGVPLEKKLPLEEKK